MATPQITSAKVELLEDADDLEETETLVEKGKEEATAEPEIPEKTFLERVSDLLGTLRGIDEFKEHPGLINFDKVVETTNKKSGVQRENLELGMKGAFEKFYDANRRFILDGKWEFLKKDDLVITFGTSGKANIPLSDIYSHVFESNPEEIDSVEGAIYFVMQHVCPDEDLAKIMEICSEFEPQQQEGGPANFLGFIGNIVGRVSEKVTGANARNLETEDGQINTAAIGEVVQDLLGDGQINQNMKQMMTSVTGEDFDINSTLQGLLNMGKSAKK
jgi:hypothetical protein